MFEWLSDVWTDPQPGAGQGYGVYADSGSGANNALDLFTGPGDLWDFGAGSQTASVDDGWSGVLKDILGTAKEFPGLVRAGSRLATYAGMGGFSGGQKRPKRRRSILEQKLLQALFMPDKPISITEEELMSEDFLPDMSPPMRDPYGGQGGYAAFDAISNIIPGMLGIERPAYDPNNKPQNVIPVPVWPGSPGWPYPGGAIWERPPVGTSWPGSQPVRGGPQTEALIAEIMRGLGG